MSGRYQQLQPQANGWLWSQQLELYLGIHESKLRFFTCVGQLIPTPQEVTEQERQQKEQAQLQAEQERQQKEQARAKVAQMQALLTRYREQFGDLSEYKITIY